MLSELEKIDFARSTIRPMAEYTSRFLTQVVGVIDDSTWNSSGRGYSAKSVVGKRSSPRPTI